MKKYLIILAIFSTVALGVTVKQNVSINAFNAGELSPLINSRSDLAQYKVGAKTLENMLVTSQGPVRRRPGTRYVATAKNNTNVRLISFEYSTEEAYIIELGDEYMRFYLSSDGTPAQIVDVNDDPIEVVTPYDGNDVFELQFAQDAQFMRIAHPDYPPYILSRQAEDEWTCSQIEFEGGPFLDENEDRTSTITTDGLTGDVNMVATGGIFDDDHVGALWQVSHVVEANTVKGQFVLNWAPASNPPSDSLYIQEGRLYDYYTSGWWNGTVRLQRSYDDESTWEDVYVYSTNGTGNVQYSGIEENDDAYYRVYFDDDYTQWDKSYLIYNITTRSYIDHGVIEITSVTDANNAVGTVDSDYELDANDATWRWAEGAWSDYRGWPRAITHHEQRVVYGGSDSYPETIWASVIMQKFEDYNDFDIGDGANDASAWIYILPGYNPIQWMVSREYLMIGTTNGVGRLGQPDKPITPTFAPTFRMQAINGCEYMQAIPVSDTILYVERGSKKVREVTYTYTSERYIAPDMTILAEHITGDGITSIAFQERPDPILWCTRDDGALLSFTYNRHYGVESWASNITDEGDDDIESVATMPGVTESEVWWAVDRDINSTDYIYIEQLQPFDWYADEDMNDAWFVDCGGTDPNDLSHLEGKTVALLGDGEYIGDFTVSGGEIDSNSYSNYTVGLPYTSTFETMPIVTYTDYGESSSYYARIQNLVLDIYQTLEFDVGTSEDYKSTQDIDELTTDVWDTEFPRGQFREPTIYIDVNDPTPFCLRGLSCTLEVSYDE